MESNICKAEKVDNKERKFGEVMEYYPCRIDGEPALFTRHQMDIAILRARRNPEDIPEDQSFWSFLGL